VHCQLATPGSRLQYWVTAPLAGLMATVNPTPPVARAPKKLFTDGWKSKFWESAQMNDPTVVAFARRPAAVAQAAPANATSSIGDARMLFLSWASA